MTDTISKERVIQDAQNIYDMFVSNYGFSSVLALDMKTVLDSLRTALAQQAEQGVIKGLQVTVTALLREVDAGWSPDARKHLLKLDTTIAMLAAAPRGGV